MGRVLTNTTAMGYAVESSPGVIPTSGWKTIEPNGIPAFGAETTTTPRNPISNRRQRRKGTVTDLDSSVEVEADLTVDLLEDFIEAFVFATAENGDLTFRGANATGTAYTIPAATAAQGAKLQFNSGGPISLLFARGYVNAANNGLKPLTADTAAAGTSLTVAGNVIETAPTNAVVEIAGIRCTTGDLAITVSGTTATLTSGNNGVVGAATVNFTTLGLVAGQTIHVGGVSANRFSAGFGYGRIRTIAAASIVLDKLQGTLATDTGAGDQVDLLFGKFLRNVAVGATGYLERSICFEAVFPGLGNPSGERYQYAKGNYANELAFNMPLTDKANVTVGFIGLDTDNVTSVRATGASAARAPQKTGAFNTSADFLRLRVTQVDETGLTTDFKNITLTLANNVSPEKVLGVLGAKFVNFGNFEVDLEAQIVFTEQLVIDAIRANTTVTMDFSLRNSDGAVFVDIPAMTLGGGDREFPQNESVLLNLTGEAFEDPTLGTSLGLSLFPVVP